MRRKTTEGLYEDLFILIFIILEVWPLSKDVSLFLLVGLFIGIAFTPALSVFSILKYLLLLFVILGLLQADEILTINLIKLVFDIVDDLVDAGNQDELERIDAPVCHLERGVERLELRLQRRNLYQDLEELCELFFRILNRLTSLSETQQVLIATFIDLEQFEEGDLNTSNVLLLL